MTQEEYETELLNLVNKTYKSTVCERVGKHHWMNTGQVLCKDEWVALFDSACRQAVEMGDVAWRCGVQVTAQENGVDVFGVVIREETDDEHVARCRTALDEAIRAKQVRRRQYEVLKAEFGDA